MRPAGNFGGARQEIQEYATWLYLHDFDGQATTPGFMDIGFRSNDALVIRPSDVTWQAAVDLRERP